MSKFLVRNSSFAVIHLAAAFAAVFASPETAAASAQAHASVTLLPGLNEVDEKHWRAVEKSPAVAFRLKKRILQIVASPLTAGKGDKAQKYTGSLADFSTEAALDHVAECGSKELLLRWSDAEKRGQVKRAIEDRLKEIDPRNKGGAESQASSAVSSSSFGGDEVPAVENEKVIV